MTLRNLCCLMGKPLLQRQGQRAAASQPASASLCTSSHEQMSQAARFCCAHSRPVDGARICKAGEGEEEFQVLAAPREAVDAANAWQGDALLQAASGQAAQLELGAHICQVARHQVVPLHVQAQLMLAH